MTVGWRAPKATTTSIALAGTNSIVGRGGNDRLFGGDGYDQANYFGSSTDFSFVLNLDGTVTVTDLVGDEGVDILDGVEALWFAGDETWMSVEDAVGGAATRQAQITIGPDQAVSKAAPMAEVNPKPFWRTNGKRRRWSCRRSDASPKARKARSSAGRIRTTTSCSSPRIPGRWFDRRNTPSNSIRGSSGTPAAAGKPC